MNLQNDHAQFRVSDYHSDQPFLHCSKGETFGNFRDVSLVWLTPEDLDANIKMKNQ